MGMSTVGCTSAVDIALVTFLPPLLCTDNPFFGHYTLKISSFQALKMSSRRSAFHSNVDIVWQYHAF